MFFLKQEMVELVDQILGVVGFVLNAKFVVNATNELFRAQLGVENVGRDGFFIQALQKGSAQGGLPGTDLTGDLNKAVALGDGLVQMRQRFFMASAEKKVFRIRHQLERFLTKSEIGIVHG
jgi:hypothetical protein